MQNSTLKLFCCPSNNQRRPVQEVGALGPWMTTCRDTNCTHTYISHINIFLNQENWLNYIQCMKYMNMKHPAPMPIHAMTCSKNKVYEVQNISNCHWLFSVLTVMTFLYRIRNKISHYSEQTCCSHIWTSWCHYLLDPSLPLNSILVQTFYKNKLDLLWADWSNCSNAQI